MHISHFRAEYLDFPNINLFWDTLISGQFIHVENRSVFRPEEKVSRSRGNDGIDFAPASAPEQEE